MVCRLDPRLERNGALMRRHLASLLAAILLVGCTAEPKLGPVTPPPPPVEGGFARAAFLAEVNLRSGRIDITAPGLTVTQALRSGDDPSWSLVGGDAVELVSSNFIASSVGAFTPGKIRVTFDVAITSRLDNVRLRAPTSFPEPPPGTSGPLLFPYDIAVAVTSGGTSTGGQGNDVVVVQPSLGLVAPSGDWNGEPWSFFNDAACPGDDCFRFEEYPAIEPRGASMVQRVGFDLDPTVGQFTARLILAADLEATDTPVSGSIQGSVTAGTLGPIAGVTVTLAPGGQVTLTDAAGNFRIDNVPVGLGALSFGGLPSTCAAQPSYPVTVIAGTITAFPLTLTCSTPSFIGALRGLISRSDGGTLSGVVVTVTPTGGLSEPSVATNAIGEYLVTSVDVGDGTGVMTLGMLPAECSNPGPIGYTGLITGGTLTQDVVLVCGP